MRTASSTARFAEDIRVRGCAVIGRRKCGELLDSVGVLNRVRNFVAPEESTRRNTGFFTAASVTSSFRTR